MDNRGVEELLSSFASDAFAIQSQPEKDLRACLMNFFSVGHGPDGPSDHRNANIHASSGRQSNHSASNPSLPVEAQMSVSYQASELPPPNTPLGSPMKEDVFNFPAPTTNAFSPQDYPVTPSLADNKAQNPIHHAVTPSHNSSFGSCPSCSHSLTFHQDDPRLLHAPNCHFDQFNNNHQSPLGQDSNLSSSHSPSDQCRLPAQFNP
ncbi:hypothetical protein PGTUg99_014806 [Puccinia graminis f. sp. tritici]|uniref:Uncharacterized protein n=1 Tax=Puccinia graminis f. sp. tritici TaxID=56615 RepID=A0A5B0MRY1_PUCGR|nr:hypothetical protein PGTUg99_014806 [Puccinia graminis f. sp. tritici]